MTTGELMSKPIRVHVVGSSPRSGTTLMFELITSCFALEKFGDHEISIYERWVDAEGVYASKQPMDFVHVKRLMKWDQNLYCIYMQRDPRDTIVSQHGSRPGEYWCDFDVWERNDTLFSGMGNHPRIIECRYEDLAANPDSVQETLMKKFAFLEKRHAFSEFSKVSQSSEAAQLALKGVRDISTSSIGKWRADLPRMAAQLQQYPQMSQRVVQSGYETDTTWTDALNGVVPDTSESVRSRHNTLRGKSAIG